MVRAMLMLGLKETMDELAMANSVCWYGHVLRREDGHILRRALDFEVEGEREHGKSRLCEGWFEKERCALPFKVECRRRYDCCWVEVNLATLTFWGYYQILNIGFYISLLF